MLIASASATFHDALHRCFSKGDGARPAGTDATPAAMTSVFDVRQLLLAVHVGRPEILMLDSDLAKRMHQPLLPTIQGLRPDIRILLFFEAFSCAQALQALAEGAKGCILKSAAPAEWRKAIQALEGGELWLDRKLLAQALTSLCDQLRQGRQDASVRTGMAEDAPYLTQREREIARWAGGSMTNKEIARHLHISEATVKTHLQNIFLKLKITRRMQLLGASEAA